MSVTEPPLGAQALCDLGERAAKPVPGEDRALRRHHPGGDARAAVRSPGESGVEHVHHAPLDGEPGQGVDRFDEGKGKGRVMAPCCAPCSIGGRSLAPWAPPWRGRRDRASGRPSLVAYHYTRRGTLPVRVKTSRIASWMASGATRTRRHPRVRTPGRGRSGQPRLRPSAKTIVTRAVGAQLVPSAGYSSPQAGPRPRRHTGGPFRDAP
jgi:hypothetical protein